MSTRVQSILSYIGILWLVAYFGGKSQRNDFSSYHLKQGLGLLLFSFLFGVIVNIVGFFFASLAGILAYAGILFFIVMVIGIINAANDVKKPLPLVGELFDKQFPFLDRESNTD
ncbi:DUF4870 domain-containing protein [Sphingobacterium siyangense]|uniref:DUF4870 domain-containing protein n=1 Tax=Sphingobacterium siyangense TaxID=459529 RepID=UPI0028966A1D|nr:DUF4870 domain-containing protein [Sphingobacterium siyangense]